MTKSEALHFRTLPRVPLSPRLSEGPTGPARPFLIGAAKNPQKTPQNINGTGAFGAPDVPMWTSPELQRPARHGRRPIEAVWVASIELKGN